FPVAKVAYGDATRLDAGCLMISRDELARAVAHPAIAGVDVELTHPGESVRITQVSDVVEPRVKVSGGGDVFPGLLGPVEGVGAGRTHRLAGLAVMVCGEVPWLGASGLFVPRDNFVDTGGPGAEFTPHSWTSNVVLTLSFVDGLTHEDYQRAVVLAGLRAARLLAMSTRALTPSSLVVRDLSISSDLPRVVYAYQVQSQGVFMRSYLYGRSLDELLP